MRLNLTCKHMDLTDGIKTHVEAKAEKFNKYFEGRFNVSWTFDIDGGMHLANVTVKGKNFFHCAEGRTTNLYSSIDQACSKLQRQLNKTKNIKKDHRKEKVRVTDMDAAVEYYSEDFDLYKKAA